MIQSNTGGIEGDAIDKLQTARQRIIDQLGKVIVGQTEVIDELLISIFSRGHCLLEGVPGLAKTTAPTLVACFITHCECRSRVPLTVVPHCPTAENQI